MMKPLLDGRALSLALCPCVENSVPRSREQAAIEPRRLELSTKRLYLAMPAPSVSPNHCAKNSIAADGASNPLVVFPKSRGKAESWFDRSAIRAELRWVDPDRLPPVPAASLSVDGTLLLKPTPLRSWPMLKCCSERCVCALQSLSAGTSRRPRCLFLFEIQSWNCSDSNATLIGREK
jgi:hypothetical protein